MRATITTALSALLIAASSIAPQPAAAATSTPVPQRVLDTRDGTGAREGRLAPGETLVLDVAATRGDGSVALNLTAADALEPGYVTAWPCHEPRPDTSVLNFEPGRAVPNLAVVQRSPDGVCLATSQPVHLIGDLMATFDGPASVVGIPPSRLLDTRSTGPSMGAGTLRRVDVVAEGGVDERAAAAVLNITAVSPSADGFLTAAACDRFDGGTAPSTSTVNFRSGETVAGSTLVSLTAGEVCVYSSIDTHVLVDVFGWLADAEIGTGPPARLLDTRSGIWSSGPALDGVTVPVRIAGRGGVPNDAEAVIVSLTAISDSSGYVTVWPCDAPMPTTSILNVWPGAVRTNAAVVGISRDDGEVCLQASTNDGAPIHLLADTTGWVRGDIDRAAPAEPPPSTPPPSPPSPPSSGSGTLPPGSALPSGAQCASRVRPAPEIRAANSVYNATRGTRPNELFPRVDGDFTGTTDEIIQWAACKWGIDEDIVRAQVVKESWWNQNAVGDNGESFGLGQVRVGYHDVAFVDDNAIRSSAYNLDYTYAIWRSCYEGNETWLNDFERGATYAAGDVWGCLGVWFTGRWYVPGVWVYLDGGPTDGYGNMGIRQHIEARTWEHPDFLGG